MVDIPILTKMLDRELASYLGENDYGNLKKKDEVWPAQLREYHVFGLEFFESGSFSEKSIYLCVKADGSALVISSKETNEINLGAAINQFKTQIRDIPKNIIKVAIEGISHDLVPFISNKLRRFKFNINYEHESPYLHNNYKDFRLVPEPNKLVECMLNPNADVNLVCNARGYFPFFEIYIKKTDKPLIVITGDSGLVEKIKQFTPHILIAPDFGIDNLSKQLILAHKKYSSKRDNSN